MQDEYPLVDIDLTVDVTSNMRAELVNRTLDISFLMGPISEFSIQNIDLSSFELTWVCSPALGFPEEEIPIADILAKPVITYARNTRPFAEIQALSKEENVELFRLVPSTSLSACKRMALDGLGVSVSCLSSLVQR